MTAYSSQGQFEYLDAPFKFNAPDVAKYPPEVTGYRILQSMASRLGWDSLRGKRILDFGCGVRFAQTILNLGIDVGLYAGVDIHAPAIAWLKEHVSDPRFIFEHLDVYHPWYRPDGPKVDEYAVMPSLIGQSFDVACLFSVITHQSPEDAARVFRLLRRIMGEGSRLYFTAFVSDSAESYSEGDPSTPTHMSTYNPVYLCDILAAAGWAVEGRFERTEFQQPAFIARSL